MADRVQAILEKALDALVRQDAITARARAGRRRRDRRDVPGAARRAQGRSSRDDLEHLDAIVLLFSVARYLERLADHATNIAEDVLYMVEGEIHRHQAPDSPAALFGLECDEERFAPD